SQSRYARNSLGWRIGHLLRVIHSILELFARCTTAIRNCCSVFSASCRARNWASMSRSTRTLDVFPDDRLLIQINPSVLLLHSVHRSARRRKDLSFVGNLSSVLE